MSSIKNRFSELNKIVTENGISSLNNICLNNNYNYKKTYCKLQLIHLILFHEFPFKIYNQFVNFKDINNIEYTNRLNELNGVTNTILKNILKSYNLTQNGTKKYLIDRIIYFEFYNKIIIYSSQLKLHNYKIRHNLNYIPLLNYTYPNYNNNYNLNLIYKPNEFYNMDEYIKHMENLKITNNYNIINEHFSLLNNDLLRAVTTNLIDLGWDFNIDYDSVIENTVNEKYCNKTSNNNIISKIKEFKCNECDDNCVICMDKINKNDSCKKLSCNHVFHSTCIDNWLVKILECPICRNVIT